MTLAHRVTQTGEIKIADVDCRNHDRVPRIAVFARADAFGDTRCLQAIQYENRLIVEAKLLHRFRDRAILDQMRSVASETGIAGRALVDGPQIPKNA